MATNTIVAPPTADGEVEITTRQAGSVRSRETANAIRESTRVRCNGGCSAAVN